MGWKRDYTASFTPPTIITVHHFDRAVGLALRRSREAAGLSLKEVERITDCRFKPSTIAGYERGERSITVSRFVELATVYGALPNGLLAEAVARSGEGFDRLVVVSPNGEVAIEAELALDEERRVLD